MTKQEAIEKAYGDHWDKVKDFVDNEGWMSSPYQPVLNTMICDYKVMHIVFGHPENWYRPITLKGIENNNGWIKIESEDDLPKESGNYYVYVSGNIYNSSFIPSNRWFLPTNDYPKTYQTLNITHYRPIIKPEPPIY